MKIVLMSIMAGLILSADLAAGGGTGLIDVPGVFGRIEGTLVDSQTDRPVIGASVSLRDTPFGAVSDFEGFFEIPFLRPGNYTLRIMHLNYCRATIENIEVAADSTSTVHYGLAEMLMPASGALCPNPALHGHPPRFTVIGKLDIRDKFGGHWRHSDIAWETIRVRTVLSHDDLLARVPGVRPQIIDVERDRNR